MAIFHALMKVRSLSNLLRVAPALCLTSSALAADGGAPVITSLARGGLLTWDSPFADGVAFVEKSTNFIDGPWRAVSLDRMTQGQRSVALPYAPEPNHFYRIQSITSPPDTNLLLRLTFENDFIRQGAVLDVSGYAHHGIRYHTNHWPTTIKGPDGSQAGEFRVYYDGYGPGKKSGDYLAIAHTPELKELTKATIMGWAYFFKTPVGGLDHTATIIDGAGAATPGSWTLGRNYSGNTRFSLVGPGNTTVYAVRFPDETRTGDTGGWNHYAVTFDEGKVSGFYNGSSFLSTNIPFPKLILGGEFMCVSCWNHSGTPEWDDGDGLPNNAFMNGAIDEVRVYNRVLTPEELKAIYEETGPAPASAP